MVGADGRQPWQVYARPFSATDRRGRIAIVIGQMGVAGAAMYAPYGPFWALVPELLPQNVAGGAMALINSVGAFGAFVGAFGVGYLNAITGGPTASITLMAVALALAAGLIGFVR